MVGAPALGRTSAEVERAKAGWLAAIRDAGKPIPKPRYRPAIYQLAH